MKRTQAQEVWPQRTFSELMGKIGISLLLVVAFAIVQALRHSFSGNDWAFGSYMVFYKGFWGLVELKNGFSIWVVVGSIFFILVGYSIVKNFYKITEIDRAFMKMAKEKGLIPAQSNNEG